MIYDPKEVLDLIPKNILEQIRLVNISYRCPECDRLSYMPRLTTEKRCRCGRMISMSRAWQLHYLKRDPSVRRQAQAILKKLGAI